MTSIRVTRPLIALMVLGLFSGSIMECGEPLLRIWAIEQGYSRASLGWLNIIHLLYGLKFLWAPLFSIPLQGLPGGNRRGWILITGCIATLCILGFVFCPFLSYPFIMLFGLFMMARASLDMLIIASQMDAVTPSYWGIGEIFCENGYRFGVMIVGATALFLSSQGWSWSFIYILFSLILGVGCLAVAFWRGFDFLSTAPVPPARTLRQTFIVPFKEWLQRPGWPLILGITMLYGGQDALINPMREILFLDLGMTKAQIAWTTKTVGVVCGMLGGGLAGWAIRRRGFSWTLLTGIILHIFTGLGLAIVVGLHQPIGLLTWANGLESLAKGFGLIALYSFQLRSSQAEHAVTQLALLTAAKTLGTQLLGASSGWIAEEGGWMIWFAVALSLNIPIWWIVRRYIATAGLAADDHTGKPQ